MLRIDIKNMNGAAVLRCSGRLVFGVEVETLRGIAKARPEKWIRIDMRLVEKLDASGLGVMVELQHWAKCNRRELAFENVCEPLQRLLSLTRLDSVLNLDQFDAIPLPAPEQQSARRAMIA